MKTVLIIEDELAYQKLLQDQLNEHGYDTIKASDGQKGLELAKLHHPDLVLLDIRLPLMDGMSVLSEMRKDDYGKSVKIIILTNLEPSDDMIKQVFNNKPSYYLVKSDTQLKDLMAKVDELLN